MNNKHCCLLERLIDIKKEILYTRIHSSCITSETFRSQDCDCVQQLYGAFKKISEKEDGKTTAVSHKDSKDKLEEKNFFRKLTLIQLFSAVRSSLEL